MSEEKDVANTPSVEIKQRHPNGIAGVFSKMTDDSTIIGSVCKNVIIPRLVDTAYEGSIAALKKFFWGEDTKWSRSSQTSKQSSIVIGGRTDYSAISRSGPEPSRTESALVSSIGNVGRRKANAYTIRIRDGNGVDAWKKGLEIEEILIDKLQMSGLISVQDLYQAAGVTDIPSSALNWGWDSVAQLRRFRDLDDQNIVVIELPKPRDISML